MIVVGCVRVCARVCVCVRESTLLSFRRVILLPLHFSLKAAVRTPNQLVLVHATVLQYIPI